MGAASLGQTGPWTTQQLAAKASPNLCGVCTSSFDKSHNRIEYEEEAAQIYSSLP